MTDLDSWLVVHLCYKPGKCCSSNRLQDIATSVHGISKTVDSTDECFGVMLDRLGWGDDARSVRIEHSGSDAVLLHRLDFELPGKTSIICRHDSGNILLAGEMTVDLSCKTLIRIFK